MFSDIAKLYNLWRCVDEFYDVTYLLDETLSFSQKFFFFQASLFFQYTFPRFPEHNAVKLVPCILTSPIPFDPILISSGKTPNGARGTNSSCLPVPWSGMPTWELTYTCVLMVGETSACRGKSMQARENIQNPQSRSSLKPLLTIEATCCQGVTNKAKLNI